MRYESLLNRKILADVLSVEDLHAHTSFSKDWIRSQLRAGRLRGRKLGGRWLVLREAFLQFLRAEPPALRVVDDAEPDARRGSGR